MKIIIIGKRDQMGTTPSMRVKGMSQVRYNFIWDSKLGIMHMSPKTRRK